MASKNDGPSQGNKRACYDETDPRQNPELASSFKGNNVVIAGAGRGIGRACAKFITRAAARSLTLVALEQNKLEDTAEACRRINENVLIKVAAADVCDAAWAEEILTEVDRDYGGVDVLLMNAGRLPQWLPTADQTRASGGAPSPCLCRRLQLQSLCRADDAAQKGRHSHLHVQCRRTRQQRHGQLHDWHARHGPPACEILHQHFKEHNIKVFTYNSGCIPTRLLTDFVDFLDGKPAEGIYLVKGLPGEQQSAETVKKFFTGVTVDTPELAARLVTALAAGKLDFMSGRYLDAYRHINKYIAEKDAIQKKDLHRVKLHLAERFLPI